MVEDDVLKVRSHRFNIGPLIFELVEPLAKDSIYQESIQSRGDGIVDLVFLVKDLELEVEKLIANGAGLLLKENYQSRKSVFLDTRTEGNIITRLIQS